MSYHCLRSAFLHPRRLWSANTQHEFPKGSESSWRIHKPETKARMNEGKPYLPWYLFTT